MGCLAVFSPVISNDPWLNFTPSSSSSSSSFRVGTNFNSRKQQSLSCCYRNNSSSRDNENQPHQDALLNAILADGDEDKKKDDNNMRKAAFEIETLIEKLSIGGLIVGKPYNRGKPSPSTTQVTRFVEGLDKTKVLKGVNYAYWEECFTSKQAENVNIYPTARGFTAIGSGGDDFVQSMVVAVESVVQHPIPQGKVKQKLSSGGKYVSVNIGPVQIVSSKQVQAVYYAMKRDDRMRYFL
ncbi:phosphoribosylformylglycinamidine synthase [Tanacetum coccineum]